jgi:heptosyltransferase-1
VRILVVKLSSLGDVIHTLPAITDAAAAVPGLAVDWVVEEAFAEIPAWHPAVDRVIPVALRRWRRRPWRDLRGPEWARARRALAARRYDKVIDAQGLVKSAVLSRYAAGTRLGFDRRCAREGLAALAYDRRLPVPVAQHAVERLRQLFAASLGYRRPGSEPDYGLHSAAGEGPEGPAGDRGIVFLHGSARREKLWPQTHWVELARTAAAAGHDVLLPSGNREESERARRIVADSDPARVRVLPAADLAGLAARLRGAAGMVAVDTGPGHLAAALGVPGVSLYGPTRPDLVGTLAPGQVHLRGDGTMAGIEPAQVWHALAPRLRGRRDD